MALTIPDEPTAMAQCRLSIAPRRAQSSWRSIRARVVRWSVCTPPSGRLERSATSSIASPRLVMRLCQS